MMNRKQAENQADMLTEIHGEAWTVFKTPDAAPCNQEPFNYYNTGRFSVCKVSEEQVYTDGGAELTGYRPKEARG